MRFVGFVPEDAPDPRVEQAERLAAMPVAVVGLVPQASLEESPLLNSQSSSGSDGTTQMSVSVNYTLWRNPADRSDPVNLAEIDEALLQTIDDAKREALGAPSPHPRPAWMLEQIEQMRYPSIWEAVRTDWHREPSELSEPRRLLVEHANYVLMNRFRRELGLGDITSDRFQERLGVRAVNERGPVLLDGAEVPAIEIDTDPFVYAVGFERGEGVMVTAVIPRDDLEYVTLEFATREPDVFG